MNRIRFSSISLVGALALSVALFSPVLGVLGSSDRGASPTEPLRREDLAELQKYEKDVEVNMDAAVTVSTFAAPNVVVNGDTVVFTTFVRNETNEKQSITVIDSMGELNRGILYGVGGGRIIFLEGSQRVFGMQARYVTGDIDTTSGVTIRNINAGSSVIIQYKGIVSSTGVLSDSIAQVRNEAQITSGDRDVVGIRILGKNVTEIGRVCSSPEYQEFPDTSSSLELKCYENNLSDTGRITGPDYYNASEVAEILVEDLGTCSYSAARDFVDVSMDYELQCAVSLVYDFGFMTGYGDGTFAPDSGITRAEFVKVILTARETYIAPYEGQISRFADVSGDHSLKTYIIAATELGIVSGYSDGTFRPNEQISRKEVTKVVLRAFGLGTSEVIPRQYKDLDPADPLAAYIGRASTLGILQGHDGYIYPNSSMNRAEVAQVISKVLGYLADGTTVIR